MAGGVIVYAQAMPNNDVLWILTATSKWLDGARLYRDVVEVNPPQIFYLNGPPVLFSKLAGIPAYTAFVGYVFLLIGMSVAMTAGLARRLEPEGAGRRVLTLAVLVVLVAFPSTDFGQREHLMLVFCLPYLLLAALRAEGAEVDARLAGLCGLFAGLGFCLKPFFLLVPLSLELYLAAQLRARWSLRRPETATLALVGLAYAASIPLLAPDYLGEVVPRALLVYQWGYSNPPAFLLVT